MTTTCIATAKSGRPCQALAIRWPYGIDGNPHLCAKHAPTRLREMRDTLFAEEERRRVERLDARDPGCWLWGASLNWDDIAVYYGGPTGDLLRRFEEREEGALRIVFAAWHNNRCAVCGFPDGRLVMDHDHDTGLIRGLLCRSCNGCEPHNGGLFDKYRQKHPAQILGIELRYFDPFNGWAQPNRRRRQLDGHPAYALAAKLGARLEQGDATSERDRPVSGTQ